MCAHVKPWGNTLSRVLWVLGVATPSVSFWWLPTWNRAVNAGTFSTAEPVNVHRRIGNVHRMQCSRGRWRSSEKRCGRITLPDSEELPWHDDRESLVHCIHPLRANHHAIESQTGYSCRVSSSGLPCHSSASSNASIRETFVSWCNVNGIHHDANWCILGTSSLAYPVFSVFQAGFLKVKMFHIRACKDMTRYCLHVLPFSEGWFGPLSSCESAEAIVRVFSAQWNGATLACRCFVRLLALAYMVVSVRPPLATGSLTKDMRFYHQWRMFI